ncbi:MAG: RagB/SusD family nutrient uptake outer membrane protein [Bacteroidales bacterium]|nr:RagB/SusD family nutrient uptake outer membrane protein [Bacteroidales bacterium]
MKNILKSIAVISLTAFVAAGCMKEVLPQGSTKTASQIAESPAALEAMVNAIPSSMTTTNFLGFDGDHWDFGMPSLHIITDSMLEDLVTMGDTPGYNRYYQWKANRFQGADYDYCYYIWSAYYTYIKSTNDIISTIDPGAASAAVLSFLGQAYTCRASYYLDLARLYDPVENEYTDVSAVKGLTVPIVDENIDEETAKNNPRATRAEILDFILSDLANAEAYIDPSLKDYTKPSLAAVYALYARAYLIKGYWEDSQEAFDSAAEYAQKAIDQSGATPLTQDEWEDPTNGFNNGASNKAWIWGLPLSAENLGNIQTFVSMMSNEATFGYAPYVKVGCSKRFYDSISDSDFRKHSWVDPAYVKDPKAKLPYDYKFAGSSEAQATFIGKLVPYMSIKFRPAQGEVATYSVGNTADHPLLRVEELWFIKIEALAKSGKLADAQALLNDFMALRCTDGSYDCSSFSDEDSFLEEMLLQKRVEFWGEGVLFYDYKRLEHSITRGYDESNEAGVFRLNTEGPSPQWNIVIPISETNYNSGIPENKNNPDPSGLLTPWEK